MNNIMIIGSGGREHALAWKIRQESSVGKIYVVPGNGGTAEIGTNVPLDPGDVDGLVEFAKKNHAHFIIPGTELPLTRGITDAMKKAGIVCYGPIAACARLEGSKAFAKEIMKAAGVPTAESWVFHTRGEADAFVEKHGAPLVVKADGLAAGKGVIVCMDMDQVYAALDQMFEGGVFGEAGQTVVIEEFLQGEEVSLICFCDGVHAIPLPSMQDHKAAFDGDEGPNTGGMGAYCPAPILPDSELKAMAELVAQPIVDEMARRRTPYKGMLYAGLMITKDGPKVLEYNVRFGDPECQPVLARFQSSLLELILLCYGGGGEHYPLKFDPRPAVSVVLTADGYPGPYPKGMPISGLDEVKTMKDVFVFHAGTKREEDGRIVSTGGRVLCVTALGDDLAQAQARAYEAMSKISMPHGRFRHDIALKGLKRLGLA